MFLSGLRTQIIVLIVLAMVGGTALYLSRSGGASPYGKGSEADVMWQVCARHAKVSREFALCICPVDQIMREIPDAQCLHLAVMRQTFYAESSGRPVKSADIILKTLPRACKDKQTEPVMEVYERIVSECGMRYQRKDAM